MCVCLCNRSFFSDMIREINDPEHPLTLEELNVVEESKVEVSTVNKVVNM